MSRRHGLSEEESGLFRAAVGPVKPVRHDRVVHRRPGPPPYPRQTLKDEEQVILELLSDSQAPWDLESGDELYYAQPGLQHGVLRRLRRGQLSVARQLDLHGMTVSVARDALAAFLRDSRRDGVRCVRIIHGKGRGSRQGQPVLKRKVDHWLRQREEVLAFASARPVDGGTGAVYVLLKR